MAFKLRIAYPINPDMYRRTKNLVSSFRRGLLYLIELFLPFLLPPPLKLVCLFYLNFGSDKDKRQRQKKNK